MGLRSTNRIGKIQAKFFIAQVISQGIDSNLANLFLIQGCRKPGIELQDDVFSIDNLLLNSHLFIDLIINFFYLTKANFYNRGGSKQQ